MIEYSFPNSADTGEAQQCRLFVTSIELCPDHPTPDDPEQGVMLLRDPEDPYDPNSIVVLTFEGVHLGHLSREDAAFLAPLIDRKQICLLGRFFPANYPRDEATATIHGPRLELLCIDVSWLPPDFGSRRESDDWDFDDLHPTDRFNATLCSSGPL